jgi:hypothetical protein
MRVFEIDNQKENINIVLITINILVISLPFICFQLFHEKLFIFFEDYFMKYFTIYCDTKEDLDFKNKLKDPNIQISQHTSAPNIGTMLDSWKKIRNINEIGQMNNLFFCYILTEHNINNEFICCEETYTKFINHPLFNYKLDPQIIEFINNNMDLIDNPNISKEDLKAYSDELYPLYLKVNKEIEYIKTIYTNIMLKVGNGLSPYFINTIFSWFVEDIDFSMNAHEKKVQAVIDHFEKKSEERLQPRLSKVDRLKSLLGNNQLASTKIFDYNNSNSSTSSLSSIDSNKTIEHKKNNYPSITN